MELIISYQDIITDTLTTITFLTEHKLPLSEGLESRMDKLLEWESNDFHEKRSLVKED